MGRRSKSKDEGKKEKDCLPGFFSLNEFSGIGHKALYKTAAPSSSLNGSSVLEQTKNPG